MMTEASAQIVTETASGEPSQVLVELPTSSETPPSDFVQVAEIEANRDVTIAAIHAETDQARIEAEAEAQQGEENWQDAVALIRAQQTQLLETVATLSTALQSLTAPLTPPISEPAGEDLTPIQAETVIVEPTISPETPPETSEETRTEALERNEGEKPVRAKHAFMI